MPSKIIDLTQAFNESISVYPGTLAPELEHSATVDKDGFAELKLTTVLHAGTHIDAPCHVYKGGKSLDQFPLEKFMGKAIVIPCKDKKEITVDYLKTFKNKISEVNFILFYTGWQHKWKTEDYLASCPALTLEAAEWLTYFKLDGIGFDAFSVDHVVAAEKASQETLPRHFILLGKEILLIENLTNLDKLPDTIFDFQCLPLKIEAADGSPVRAVAMLND